MPWISRKPKRITKSKKTWKKKWSRKNTIRKNSNRVLVKVKTTKVISELANVLSFNVSMSDCLNGIDNSSTPNTDFSRYLELYDMVRPCGVKVQVIPFYNVNSVGAGGNQFYTPIYSAADYTDKNTSVAKTVPVLIEYNNVKFHNTYRPITRYFKLKKFNSAVGSWTSGGTSPQAQLGYFSTDGYTQATVQGQMPGVIYFETDNSVSADHDLKVLVTWYYAFKMRK